MATPTKKKPKGHRIEDDTPILPYMVADNVIDEVGNCVPLDMSPAEQRALADKLADRADTVYASNETFRRKIRGRGNTGRDTLYAFMRHWLASELKKTRPRVFAKLPSSFMNGEQLDCHALRHAHATKKSRARLDREIAEALSRAPKRRTHP